jgi:hypothetical protein
MSPQVAFVEQDEEFLVVGSGVGIGENECFEFGFTGEPVGGLMTKKLVKIIEVVVADLIANFDCTRRMTGLAE